MKAKKSLGQNFLVDKNIINRIVDEVSAVEGDLIIEIGPGRGAISKYLKEKGAKVIAYEVDTDLQEILTRLENENFKVVYNDFLKVNLTDDIKNIKYNKLFIVGNLPYYITTPIIEHIIDENIKFDKLTIMVQKEVAERFMASPKSKEYGYFTLVLKYYFEIQKVTNVSKKAFNPVPKVDSMVISLVERKNKPDVNIKDYFDFLKKAFSQKRKTLKNNLKTFNWVRIKEILDKFNFPETVRAEELSEDIFVEIYKNIYEN